MCNPSGHKRSASRVLFVKPPRFSFHPVGETSFRVNRSSFPDPISLCDVPGLCPTAVFRFIGNIFPACRLAFILFLICFVGTCRMGHPGQRTGTRSGSIGTGRVRVEFSQRGRLLWCRSMLITMSKNGETFATDAIYHEWSSNIC